MFVHVHKNLNLGHNLFFSKPGQICPTNVIALVSKSVLASACVRKQNFKGTYMYARLGLFVYNFFINQQHEILLNKDNHF